MIISGDAEQNGKRDATETISTNNENDDDVLLSQMGYKKVHSFTLNLTDRPNMSDEICPYRTCIEASMVT